jgi:DNA-binding NarL/FixJ family response regulator
MIRMALELHGRFRVVGEAANGLEALDMTKAMTPDLVLLDLSMPVMDGFQAAPRIRALVPAAKIVVLSGYEAEKMKEAARAAGVDAYLEKGLSPSDIADQVAAMFAAA